MIRRFLNWIVARLPEPRVIYDRAGIFPYLSRWYLLGGPREHGTFDRTGQFRDGVAWKKFPVNLFLHRFHRGDDDQELHGHPWRWAVSLILAGGYREERRRDDEVVEYVLRPWSINFIRGTDFHRVDLLEEDAWSLFLVGPKVSGWSFWNRITGEVTPWRQFIDRKRGPG